MKKTNALSLFFLLLMLSFSAMAQRNYKVTGKVTTESDNLGMPGVTVAIKGEKIGTTTDINGLFSININKGKDTLVFSMVGLKTRQISSINNPVLNVTLYDEAQQLESVIVVGYGVQKKETSVGSVTQIKSDEILKTGGVTNISSALAGLSPGLTSISSTGEPGLEQNQIFIRGRSTWGNNDPLILVDGVERSMSGVDINEVESISILKDASATAVFGVKGANGVILITTKRGKAGKTQISFNYNLGAKQPTFNFDQLDQVTARELYNEAKRNEKDWSKIYSEENIDYWRTKSDPYYHPEIDWIEETQKKFALTTQQYNLNASGGNQNIKYFTSLGYLNDGDIYKTEVQPEYDPRFKYKRYNYRSNLDFKVSNSTTINVNVAGEIGNRNRPISLFGRDPLNGTNVGGFNSTFYTAPNYLFPIRYENGILGATPIGRQDNPLYNLNYQGSGTEKSSKLFTDLIVNQDLKTLLKGLSIKGKVSYNSYYETQQLIQKDVLAIYQPSPDVAPQYLDNANPVNEYVEKPAVIGGINLSSYNRALYYEFSTNYSNQFGKNEVTGLALFNRRQYNGGSAFPSFEEAWVGRTTYAFDRKYLAEFNAAYTGSEKFARGKRFGFFPSYGIGWVLTQENFIKNTKWLNFLTNAKVKYTYGEVGSDFGASPFTYVTDYSTTGSIVLGDTQPYVTSPLYFEGKAGNTNATWETSIKQNLGIELALISKLTVEIDLYNEKRTGILMNRGNTTPIWYGQIAPDANIGETKSHGYEVNMEWNDKIGTNINYFIQGGFSFQENRIVFRDDPINRAEYLRQAGKQINFDSRILYDGFHNSWDDVYNYPASVWENSGRQPGDIKYVDFNGDGQIDDNDAVAFNYNSIPRYTYNTSLGFTYKNFNVRGNFYGVFGVDRRLPSELLYEFPNRYVMAWPESVNRWTPETAGTATRARLGIDLVRNNRQGSNYGLQNGAYLRLKTMEMSYNLKGKNLTKMGVNGCTVFLSGNNLLTFTNFDHRVDPESASTQSYPLVKRYNLGFRLNF